MSLGSGDGSNDNKTVIDVYTTVFVPQTNAYQENGINKKNFKNSSSSFTESEQLLSTNSFTASNMIDNFENTPLNSTTQTAQPSNPNVALIAGVTCGIGGLLLGVVITAVLWMYVNKRKTSSDSVQKNPKEMTFEPINLTLTRPSYGRSLSSPDKQTSVTGVLEDASIAQMHSFFPVTQENSHSYRSFEPPSPPLPLDLDYPDYTEGYESAGSLHQESVYAKGQEQADDVLIFHQQDSFEVEENKAYLQSYPFQDISKTERLKRPLSRSNRDSFSSGLGTGTESDIYPYESRSSYLPGLGMNDVKAQYDLTSNEAALHARQDHGRKSRTLEIVREHAGRRSKRSIIGNRRKQLTHESDASSSCASSGTTSMQDWSTSTEVTSTPSSTLPSVSEPPSIACDPRPPRIVEDQGERQKTEEADWESNESSDDENTKWNGIEENVNIKEEVNHDGEVKSDIVSTYFDMHFPPTPLHMTVATQQNKTDHEQEKLTKKTRTVTLIRHDSDVIHL